MQVNVLLFSSLRQPVLTLQPSMLDANVVRIRGGCKESCWVVVPLLSALSSVQACLEQSEQTVLSGKSPGCYRRWSN